MRKSVKMIFFAFLMGIVVACGSVINLLAPAPYGPIFFAVGVSLMVMINPEIYICRSRIDNSLNVLLGNIAGAALTGLVLKQIIPSLGADKVMQTGPEAYLKSFFCGMLIYAAVEAYWKMKCHPLILFLSFYVIAVCNFGFCVTDSFYAVCSSSHYSILPTVICNSLGSLAFDLGVHKNE